MLLFNFLFTYVTVERLLMVFTKVYLPFLDVLRYTSYPDAEASPFHFTFTCFAFGEVTVTFGVAGVVLAITTLVNLPYTVPLLFFTYALSL